MNRGEPRERLNIHIYPSAFRFESRMLKETATAVDSGGVDRVRIVARWEPDLPTVETIDATRDVVRIATPVGDRLPGPLGGVARFAEWQLRALFLMLRARPAVVNPHSLPVLPLATVVRVLTRCAMVYDTHELETHSVGASRLRRVVGRAIERLAIPLCAAVVVVNRSIGDWYAQRHPRARVIVVRNVPHRTAQPPDPSDRLRRELGIADDDLLFLYQGSISRGRAVDLLIEAFAAAPPDRHLVYLGYGELEDRVRAAAAEHVNVHFRDAVPPSELLPVTAGADVGVCIIEDVCLSYYLSLPNKLFEYVAAGVPALVSDYPEMRRFVDELACGWTVEVDAAAIAAKVAGLERADIEARRDAARRGRSALDWGAEAAPLRDLYRDLAAL